MRLIDADALPRFGNRKGLIHSSDVDNAPTVDAVEVVRCKDCVYCKRFNDVYQLPKLDVLICRYCCDEDEVTENDYCSWGERKGEVDE